MTSISLLEKLLATPDTLTIFAIFLVISTSFYLIIYLISKILNDEKLTLWSRRGLMEIMFSIVILSAVLVSFPMIDTILSLIFGPTTNPQTSMLSKGVMQNAGKISANICTYAQTAPDQSAYYAVKDSCYLVMSVDFLDTTFRELFTLNKWMSIRYSAVSVLANLYVNVHLAIDKQGGISYAPFSGVYLPSNIIISEVFGWANKVMIVTKVQEVIIVFMATGGFAWIFLLGLMLRPIAFTRKLGGDLMGLALAMLVIYPGFYAFGDYIINDIRAQNAQNSQFSGTDVWDIPIFANVNFSDTHFNVDPFTGKPPTNLPSTASGWTLYNAPQLNRGVISVKSGGGNKNKGYKSTTAQKELGNLVQITVPTSSSGTPATPTGSWIGKIWDGITRLISIATSYISPGLMYEKKGLIDMVARGSFFSLWFGLISIIGTIAGARSIGKMMGGDVEFAGLIRLI